jgi:uncharacterized repeat protein (TIGR02543 family)
MKGKAGKILAFSIMLVSLLLGCEDVWHPPEYKPGSSGPFLPDGKSYTVSFNANGGSGTPPGSKSAKSGESITMPNSGSLSRTGYSFDGWNTYASGTGTNYPTGTSIIVPNQNVALYAKWVQASSGGSTVSVTGVSLNKSSISLNGGYLETLTATVSPSNATNKNVSWTTSNSSVATVSNGTVTAKSPGTATITVATADGNKTATCTVTVASAVVPVSGVSLNNTSLSLAVGGSGTLTATVSPGDATNKNVSWTTSNSDVATVSGGTVTAKSVGTATITVATVDGNKTATCAVTVTAATAGPVPVTGVSLNKTSLSLTAGGSETLTATVSPSNATNKTVSWTTSNSGVATVSDGTVTAKSAGTATITVTTADGNKTATCAVTVAAAAGTVPVTGVSLNKTSLSLYDVEATTLTATVSPSNATNKTVSWTTSNSAVADVWATVDGVNVLAKSAGTATITVTTADGNKTATCAVTVVATVYVTSVSLNKTSISLNTGSKEQLLATLSPSNAHYNGLKWTTSNSSVADVVNTGTDGSGRKLAVVTAKSVGTATITATVTTADGNETAATCAVTVTGP